MKIADLLNSDSIVAAEEIHKGWSADRKLYIRIENGDELLLRISPLDQFTRKVTEFDYMNELFSKGVPVSEPLDIKGVEEEVFALFKWVNGSDSEILLPLMSEEEQYRLGVESGKILREIHKMPAQAETDSWEILYNRKIDRSLNRYSKCALQYEKDELFLTFIDQNRALIKNRPLTFQHGDYHTGNMILSDNYELRIIDFNRWDYGDPWEEFNRIDFTAGVSGIFATGQLNGYFSNQPPAEFFELLLLYISVNTLNGLPWALDYSDEEVLTMRRKAATVLEWYGEMKTVVPSWYDEDALDKYGL